MKQTENHKKYQSKKKRRRSNNSPGFWVITIFGGVLLLAAALMALGNSGSKGGKVPVTVKGEPALVVDQEKIDLGKMKLNSMANVTIQVSNEGDETLRFTQKPVVEVAEGC